MANKAVGWAWDQDTDRPIDKMVLVALADYAGKDGFSYPSLRELAAMAQCSPDSVRRSLKRLLDRNLIVTEERWRANGGRSTNGYTVLYLGSESDAYRRAEDDAEPPTPPSQIARGGMPQNARGPLAPVQGGPLQLCQGHMNPSLDPSIEKSARAGACEADAAPARAQGRVQGAHTVRRGDPSWQSWIDVLGADAGKQASAAGVIEVSQRWPDVPGARLLAIAGGAP